MLDQEQDILLDFAADARARDRPLEIEHLAVATTAQVNDPELAFRHFDSANTGHTVGP